MSTAAKNEACTKAPFTGVYPIRYAFYDKNGRLDDGLMRLQVDKCIAAGERRTLEKLRHFDLQYVEQPLELDYLSGDVVTESPQICDSAFHISERHRAPCIPEPYLDAKRPGWFTTKLAY